MGKDSVLRGATSDAMAKVVERNIEMNSIRSIGPRDEINTGNLPETRTLRDIFQRNNLAALKNALRLVELIPDTELDGKFGDVQATDDNRPMQAVRLARQLWHELVSMECAKIIIANEKRRQN